MADFSIRWDHLYCSTPPQCTDPLTLRGERVVYSQGIVEGGFCIEDNNYKYNNYYYIYNNYYIY